MISMFIKCNGNLVLRLQINYILLFENPLRLI